MDEIKEMFNTMKESMKVIIEDKEFLELSAKSSKAMVDAFVAEGFTVEQAIQLMVKK
jgi:hypothetical protein